MSLETIAFKDGPLTIEWNPKVFKPNRTTICIWENSGVVKGEDILELGTGTGVLGIKAALAGANSVDMGDIMEAACELARHNVRMHAVGNIAKVHQGSLYEPFAGKRYHRIIDDAAGFNERIGRLVCAYECTDIPTGGADGSENTIAVMRGAYEHLVPGGKLILPVASLSNYRKIDEVRQRLFDSSLVRLVFDKELPLRDEEFQKIKGILEEEQEKNGISYRTRGSKLLMGLQIYEITKL